MCVYDCVCIHTLAGLHCPEQFWRGAEKEDHNERKQGPTSLIWFSIHKKRKIQEALKFPSVIQSNPKEGKEFVNERI